MTIGMRIGSLFSGYGGLDLAVYDVLGGAVVWHCDNDPAAARVLAHRWPGTPNLGDVTAVDWRQVAPVDALIGGFPCQDVSTAGKQAGLIRYGSGRNRSGLWSQFARAIDVLRPRLVIAENVGGLLSVQADSDVEPCPWCLGADSPSRPHLRALGAVLGDLADLGFDAEWLGVRASDVGAPHARFRVFLLAYPADTDHSRWHGWGRTVGETVGGCEPAHRGAALADSGHGHVAQRARAAWRQAGQRAPERGRPRPGDRIAWGTFEPAIRRWETVLGRPVPDPTEPGPRTGRPRLAARFAEWMMGTPAGHVTDVPGLSRSQQLRLIGNGVVPQQGAYALRALLARFTAPTGLPRTAVAA